jgi:type II secretory pathway component GspD/PulD (secretin)
MPVSAALQPVCVVLALLTAGDEAPASKPAAPADSTATIAALTERLVYPIRHGSAADVAGVLDNHFKGDAEVQALPEKAGNCLYIRYRPALRDELLKTLSGLDQPPKTVAVDVIVIDVARKKEKAPEAENRPRRPGGANAEPVHPLKEGELAGPTADVIARLDGLAASGEIGGLRKMHFTGLEHHQATAQAGREVSMPSNFTVNQQTGRVAPIMQRRSIGTIVTVTPRVISETEIFLDVMVRDDRIYVADDAKPIGEDRNGPVFLPNVSTTNATGKITVKTGRTLIMQQLPSDERGESEKILIVIAAEVVSGEAKPTGK